MNFSETTRLEISLDALTNNLNVIKSHCPDKDVIAVVKANAYGHGIRIVTSHLRSRGVRRFAVSDMNEAEQISEIAKGCEILVLGQVPAGQLSMNDNPGVVLAVGNLPYAQQLSSSGRMIRCHAEIDSGMSRSGINTADELRELMTLPFLKVEALFTHFSCGDSQASEDREFTVYQRSKIVEFARMFSLPYHLQNSGGVFNHASMNGDFAIRPGLALYGYYPDDALRPVMAFKSVITQIREVGAGVPVGYGRSYVTDAPSRLAVIPAGYGDGYSRGLSNRGNVAICGQLAPVRGRVCMEYIIADVSGIAEAEVGVQVELYSCTHRETDIAHIAEMLGTIPYEVTCAVSSRVPRVAV
jgi:alanine racemase